MEAHSSIVGAMACPRPAGGVLALFGFILLEPHLVPGNETSHFFIPCIRQPGLLHFLQILSIQQTTTMTGASNNL